jgi:hypothetical protein
VGCLVCGSWCAFGVFDCLDGQGLLRQVVALRLVLDLDTGHTAKVLGVASSLNVRKPLITCLELPP